MFKRIFNGIPFLRRPISSNISRVAHTTPSNLRGTGARYYQQYQYKRFNNQQQRSFSQILADPANRKYLAITIGGGSLFYFTHLEEAPVSGRRRFIWVPRWAELKLGDLSYKSIMNEAGSELLPSNHPITKKVETIFAKIVEAAHKDPTIDKSLMDGIKWQINIVNDPKAPPNAFVLPGGKVFVYTNILGICKNDDGLATVLAHEFSHQLARHTAENLSKAPIYAFISMLLYATTGIHGIDNLLTDGLLRMPASRQMETEADYIGLMIMARACFNPEEASHLWERMTQFEKRSAGSGANIEFLSTHPASTKRINNMINWLPEAQDIYNSADCSSVNGYYKAFQDSFFGSSIPPTGATPSFGSF